MRKCYLSKNYNRLSSAGNKAKTDIEKIMQQAGFVNVGFRQTHYSNKISGFLITLLGVLKVPFSLRRGDILVLQYPLKKYYPFVCKAAHFRKCKVVTLIHDLGSFRRRKLTVQKEIERLNLSDYIIAHNQSMKNWLVEHGCKATVECLEIFDYLSESKAPEREIPTQYSILYAGGLSRKKNSFLYDLGKHIHTCHLNLYGHGFDIEQVEIGKESFSYKGFIASDQLISSAQGSFGLVWDGDSVDTCSGIFGEYLRYNNPHKTSLYIRCGLPVIIWKQAALASFVQENNIGISVGSLKEIDERLAQISSTEYKEMIENVKVIDERLSRGYYFCRAISKVQ